MSQDKWHKKRHFTKTCSKKNRMKYIKLPEKERQNNQIQLTYPFNFLPIRGIDISVPLRMSTSGKNYNKLWQKLCEFCRSQ